MIPGPDISSYLATPERAKRLLAYQLRIDGEPQERIVSLSYEASGPALVLDCTLPTRVPRSIEGKEITVDLTLGPGVYRTFTGEALRPDGRSFQAASGSYWDPILDEDMSFADAAPRSAAYAVLLKRDYAAIDVPEPTEPVFTRVGEDKYPWITQVSEVLDALKDEAQLEILDDGRNTARGFLSPALQTPGDALFSWTTDGAKAQLAEFTHSAIFAERYTHISVYRTLSDGTAQELARARVDNGHIQPPEGMVLAVEVSNGGASDISSRASEQAYSEAIRRADAEDEGDMDSVFIDPRVERGDSGIVTDVEREPGGKYTSVYAVRITGFSHTLVEDGGDVKEASYSHVAKLLSESYSQAV